MCVYACISNPNPNMLKLQTNTRLSVQNDNQMSLEFGDQAGFERGRWNKRQTERRTQRGVGMSGWEKERKRKKRKVWGKRVKDKKSVREESERQETRERRASMSKKEN